MIKFLFLSLVFFIAGCTSQYDTCLETQKEEYRHRNPKASYGQIQSKQFEFEMLCSQYKGK